MPPRCAIVPPVPVPYREPLFRSLAERGRVAPHVIYLAAHQPGWDQPQAWFAQRHGYSSQVLGSWQRARRGRSPITLPRELAGALRAARPACVVSWEYGPATLRALAWCLVRRVPLVIFSELTPHSEPALSTPQRRLHGLLATHASGFVVASSQGVRRLELLGVDPALVEVALQSIDFEPLEGPATRRAEPHDGPLRLLCVARLVPDKNVGSLIEAAAGLDVELTLAGGGPQEGELRALAGRLRVPARFLGYVAPGELPKLYAAADALALVSRYEPFGATMREGAAAGLPLVCTRAAGAAGDVAVEGENALLVDPARPEELRAALQRLASEPELRRRLADGSLAVSRRHRPEADAAAWERAVLGAIERHVGRSGPPSAE